VSSSRDRILGRISSALREKSPPFAYQPRPIFPPIGDLAERFAAECKSNYTECIFPAGPSETQRALCEVLATVGEGEVFVEDVPELHTRVSNDRRLIWSSEQPAQESCVATITRVEALVAATGSLLVTSACGGRRGTIVAPVHIAVAHRNQLVPDIEAALEVAQKDGLTERNSFVGVITGCSRTADIEKLLVIGAHGPKRLVVIVEG
jgi:L-lactate dehydrogenase complex protein LldG